MLTGTQSKPAEKTGDILAGTVQKILAKSNDTKL